MQVIDFFDPEVSGDIIGFLMIALAMLVAVAAMAVASRELVHSRRHAAEAA